MTYEQEFLKDFGEWVDQQVTIMAMAKKMAEEEQEKEAALRYESRLDAYQFLQAKFENYRKGKPFHDMGDLGKRTF